MDCLFLSWKSFLYRTPEISTAPIKKEGRFTLMHFQAFMMKVFAGGLLSHYRVSFRTKLKDSSKKNSSFQRFDLEFYER